MISDCSLHSSGHPSGGSLYLIFLSIPKLWKWSPYPRFEPEFPRGEVADAQIWAFSAQSWWLYSGFFPNPVISWQAPPIRAPCFSFPHPRFGTQKMTDGMHSWHQRSKANHFKDFHFHRGAKEKMGRTWWPMVRARCLKRGVTGDPEIIQEFPRTSLS